MLRGLTGTPLKPSTPVDPRRAARAVAALEQAALAADGLGLAQVYGFAKQSGGGVRIDTDASPANVAFTGYAWFAVLTAAVGVVIAAVAWRAVQRWAIWTPTSPSASIIGTMSAS